VALEKAQRWLGLGADITDVVIRASDHDAADAIRERLAGLLPVEKFEVMTWQELDPMVRQWLRFSTAYSLVVMFVVMGLVVAGVLNTMLMALHERTRELGVMEAVGTTGDQLFKMVLIESLLLVLVGGLLGFALGALSVAALQDTGVDLSRFGHAFRFFYMSPVIHPVVTSGSSLQIIGTTFVAALAAGLYPAWQASRIDAITALRRF